MTVTILELIKPCLTNVQAFRHLSLWELELSWRSQCYCSLEFYFRKNALLQYITLPTNYRLIKLGQPGFISLVFTTTGLSLYFPKCAIYLLLKKNVWNFMCFVFLLLREYDTFDHVLHRIKWNSPTNLSSNPKVRNKFSFPLTIYLMVWNITQLPF
jgi:hypothetical protein